MDVGAPVRKSFQHAFAVHTEVFQAKAAVEECLLGLGVFVGVSLT